MTTLQHLLWVWGEILAEILRLVSENYDTETSDMMLRRSSPNDAWISDHQARPPFPTISITKRNPPQLGFVASTCWTQPWRAASPHPDHAAVSMRRVCWSSDWGMVSLLYCGTCFVREGRQFCFRRVLSMAVCCLRLCPTLALSLKLCIYYLCQ